MTTIVNQAIQNLNLYHLEEQPTSVAQVTPLKGANLLKVQGSIPAGDKQRPVS